MNKCEYCGPAIRKNLGIKWEKRSYVCLDKNNLDITWLDTYIGENNIKIKINYCPMCGGKLSDK